MRIRPNTNMHEKDFFFNSNRRKQKECFLFKMFPMLQLLSKFDQGQQSWHENGKFTGDYSMTQFQRSRLKIVQEGSKIKVFVEFVKPYLTTLPKCTSNSRKAICRDPFTNLKSCKTYMFSNRNLPKKISDCAISLF